MIFTEPAFLFVLLPASYFIWRISIKLLGREDYILVVLILVSLLFYSWLEFWPVALLALLICVNWAGGEMIVRLSGGRHTYAKLVLAGLLLANILNLGFYKYADFLTGTITNVVLPLAISFYTFQQISYLIDVYRNRSSEKNFLRFVFVTTFFPHLVAGPILRYSEISHQLTRLTRHSFDSKRFYRGTSLILIGFCKKLLIADNLGIVVDSYWSGAVGDPGTSGMLVSALVSIAFYLQIFFDFSGYCDIAIGVAKLFNIDFPINFNAPYRATNLSDFWRRWHMSVSRFLRDYLYFPLGGSRNGPILTISALLITMALGGLWHGAAWHYILWGLMHGVALIIFHFWKINNTKYEIPRAVAWALTQCFVCLAWVLFRAPDIQTALDVLSSFGQWSPQQDLQVLYKLSDTLQSNSNARGVLGVVAAIPPALFTGLLLAASLLLAMVPLNSRRLIRFRLHSPIVTSIGYSAMAAMICFLMLSRLNQGQIVTPFIYFQF